MPTRASCCFCCCYCYYGGRERFRVACRLDTRLRAAVAYASCRAGFSVKKKLFFQNFGTLLLLGVGGTLATAGVLAAVAQPIMARSGSRAAQLLVTALIRTYCDKLFK